MYFIIISNNKEKVVARQLNAQQDNDSIRLYKQMHERDPQCTGERCRDATAFTE